jgi:hypothetical protein
MERENRIAEAEVVRCRDSARPGTPPVAVGASKDKRELLLCQTKYQRVRETRAELGMNLHGHIS